MERGPAHSPEDAMSKLKPHSQKVQTSQLLYRPSDRKTTSGEIIRSKKTAQLLRLSQNGEHAANQSLVAGSESVRLKPLRHGGFLRSRMTAELLGVDLFSN